MWDKYVEPVEGYEGVIRKGRPVDASLWDKKPANSAYVVFAKGKKCVDKGVRMLAEATARFLPASNEALTAEGAEAVEEATSEIVENTLLKDWFLEQEGAVDELEAARKVANDATKSFLERSEASLAQSSEKVVSVGAATVDKAKNFSEYCGGYLTRDNAILSLGILAAAYGAYQLYVIESESDEETQQ